LAANLRGRAGGLKAVDRLLESSIDLQYPDLSRLFSPWRDAHETKGIPPHISLLYPWRAAPVDDRDVDAVRAAIANCAAFAIRFSAIGRFPKKRVLYLKIQKNGALRALMEAVHDAFPETPPYGGGHREIIPHLTIATARDDFELDRLEQEMRHKLAARLPLAVEARSVIVAQENSDGIWSTVAELPLRSSR
jgi:2'-5' RNA ligase